jgi:YD repeat-containing protein
MKITYDPIVNVLRIILTDAPIEESNENNSGVIYDYDAEGNLIGLEVLAASTQNFIDLDRHAREKFER